MYGEGPSGSAVKPWRTVSTLIKLDVHLLQGPGDSRSEEFASRHAEKFRIEEAAPIRDRDSVGMRYFVDVPKANAASLR